MSKEFEEKALRKFEETDKKFEEVDQRFDKIEEILKSLAKSILLIEDQVVNKIPALFEAYAIHDEKLVEVKGKIAFISRKVEDHDIRISYLEEKIV